MKQYYVILKCKIENNNSKEARGGFLSCRLLNETEYKIVKKFLKEDGELYVDQFSLERVRLVKKISDENKIKVLIETFGKKFSVSDDLFEQIFYLDENKDTDENEESD